MGKLNYPLQLEPSDSPASRISGEVDLLTDVGNDVPVETSIIPTLETSRRATIHVHVWRLDSNVQDLVRVGGGEVLPPTFLKGCGLCQTTVQLGPR